MRERGASAPRGFAARSRVLARLASLAQIGELARRLLTDGWPSQYIYTILDTSFVATKTISDLRRSISPKWRSCSQANIHRLKLHSCVSDFERRKSSRLVEVARGELCVIAAVQNSVFCLTKTFSCWEFSLFS